MDAYTTPLSARAFVGIVGIAISTFAVIAGHMAFIAAVLR